MQENKFEKYDSNEEKLDVRSIESCLDKCRLSGEEKRKISNFVINLKDYLDQCDCELKSVIFFGSITAESKDSYSDADLIFLFEGNLPEKEEREKFYKNKKAKLLSSKIGKCRLSAGMDYAEDVVLSDSIYYHMDFRNNEALNQIFKQLANGDCDSFYFLHCLQNGLVAGKNSLIEKNKNYIDAIPEIAKSNFLKDKKAEISKVYNSMAKTVIREDNIRYLELLLRNIYNTVDYIFVLNNKYPGKAKGLEEKMKIFKDGINIYNSLMKSLKNALEDPMHSISQFAKDASMLTKINLHYEDD